MVRIPPALQKGDTIAITCPAGYMPAEKAATCIQTLQEWGFTVKVGKLLGGESQNYFSGTDSERLNELQEFLDDPSIKAILFGRGGYGSSRIVDALDWRKFKKDPKWVIGYSDITVFHSHIYTNYKIASLHSPMAAAFNDGGKDNAYIQSLHKALIGEPMRYTVSASEHNRKGEAIGELLGGNLSLLVHAIGTDSDIKTKGRILFIEDIGEQLYNIDRMMLQLKRAGKLDKLAGLIVGGFTDTKDTERPFGKTVQEIIMEKVASYDYPVCFDFPVSHDTPNYALKVGVGVKLKVGKKVTLEE
jgi:muramoyltetrapeptide carboxypeptidase